jgi:hypothetical protein
MLKGGVFQSRPFDIESPVLGVFRQTPLITVCIDRCQDMATIIKVKLISFAVRLPANLCLAAGGSRYLASKS